MRRLFFGAAADGFFCHPVQNVWQTGKFCDPFEATHNRLQARNDAEKQDE
jgi:hypothetical protein